MRIIVCIKQVPQSTDIRLDPNKKTLIREGKRSVINPFDSYALEAAIDIKRRFSGEVTALSMGVISTKKILKDTIARGAERGVLLCDRAFAGADTLATSYTLSLAIKKLGGADLVICGKMSTDGDTGQIGSELAEQLGIASITGVCEVILVEGGCITVKRRTDEGIDTIKSPFPILICVERDINMPKMPSIEGVRRESQSEITVWNADDLSADREKTGLKGSPTRVIKTFVPSALREAKIIEGDAKTKAGVIVGLIGEAKKWRK
jgi:electron transfer flavoprotein beta subunit